MRVDLLDSDRVHVSLRSAYLFCSDLPGPSVQLLNLHEAEAWRLREPFELFAHEISKLDCCLSAGETLACGAGSCRAGTAAASVRVCSEHTAGRPCVGPRATPASSRPFSAAGLLRPKQDQRRSSSWSRSRSVPTLTTARMAMRRGVLRATEMEDGAGKSGGSGTVSYSSASSKWRRQALDGAKWRAHVEAQWALPAHRPEDFVDASWVPTEEMPLRPSTRPWRPTWRRPSRTSTPSTPTWMPRTPTALPSATSSAPPSSPPTTLPLPARPPGVACSRSHPANFSARCCHAPSSLASVISPAVDSPAAASSPGPGGL